jgi:hypothetical protein
MKRRAFFGLLTAILAMPTTFARPCRLVGDGIADDTQALQDLLDCKPVELSDGRVVQGSPGASIRLPPGRWLVCGSIALGKSSMRPVGTNIEVQFP